MHHSWWSYNKTPTPRRRETPTFSWEIDLIDSYVWAPTTTLLCSIFLPVLVKAIPCIGKDLGMSTEAYALLTTSRPSRQAVFKGTSLCMGLEVNYRDIYSNPFLYTSQKIRLLLFSHSLKRLILSSDKPLPISDQGKPLPCAAQYLDMRSAAKAGVTVWLLMYSPALSFA